MMLTTIQMIELVVAVLLSGAIAGVVLFLLQRTTKKNNEFIIPDFSTNSTYEKMLNSDVSIDDIINSFKLI